MAGQWCISKNEVEHEDETEDHGGNNDVCSVAPVASDFLQSCGTQLKGLGSVADAVAFLFHHVDFALVFKHFVQVASHFAGNFV